MIYFDHNATTPLCVEAREAWVEAAERWIGNPSSPHRAGQRAERALNQSREELAGFLGCEPMDLAWTSGATESNNMVFHHLAREVSPDREVWVSAIEHPCTLAAAHAVFPQRVRTIPVTDSGRVDLEQIEAWLKETRPGLIAVLAANNETGVLQPWEDLLALAGEAGVPYFCDAAQWLGKLPARGLGACDFVSGCGHKFGGPKGVGFLKCPSRGPFYPLLRGGPQEEGRRAGTENLPGIVAFEAALRTREQQLERDHHREREQWRQEFEQALVDDLPGCEIVGADAPRLWNTVSALMPETDCRQRWLVKLDKLGFAVSTGSACASGKEEPSHVLAAMGYPPDRSDRVLRFSSGWETTAEDWQALRQALARVHSEMGAPVR